MSQEILQHLAAPAGAELEIRVEITARDANGYPDDTVRNVTENAWLAEGRVKSRSVKEYW